MDQDLEDWLYEDYSTNNGSGEELKCQEYETDRYKNLALIAASMGIVSLVASFLVILVIVILKKYQIFVQRLILYLSIVIALNAVTLTLRFSRVEYRNRSNEYLKTLCMATAFLDQSTRWCMTIAYTCLTFTLLIAVTFKTSGERFEREYIFGIFVLPFLINWIPFVHKTYGEAGAWCWIRTKNYMYDDDGNITSCSNHQFGVVLTYVLWYVPNYVILFSVLVVYVIVIIILIRKSRHWRGVYSTEVDVPQEKNQMKELVMPIILYPIAFFVLNFFPLLNRVYETFLEPNYYLWLLHAIFSPLQGGFVAVLYAMDKDTLRRLSMKECLAYLLHRKTNIYEYPASKAKTDSYERLTGSNIVIAKYGSLGNTLTKSTESDDHV